jgi:hypothetical protein
MAKAALVTEVGRERGWAEIRAGYVIVVVEECVSKHSGFVWVLSIFAGRDGGLGEMVTRDGT